MHLPLFKQQRQSTKGNILQDKNTQTNSSKKMNKQKCSSNTAGYEPAVWPAAGLLQQLVKHLQVDGSQRLVDHCMAHLPQQPLRLHDYMTSRCQLMCRRHHHHHR